MVDLHVRVNPRNNLTVELIRQQRFDVAYARLVDQACLQDQVQAWERCEDAVGRCADRVELSPEALANERWQPGPVQADTSVALPMSGSDGFEATTQPATNEPKELTPVTGSPALNGLGVSLIVPGTLLDVVA